MPDGDYPPGEDYAAFVLRDLMPHIKQTTRVARDRQGRAIGGISLGGSLALTLALDHPDLFSAVGGHSPAVDSTLAGWLAERASQPLIFVLSCLTCIPLRCNI